MSGDVSDRKRLISVSSSDVRSGCIHLSGHHDFFPAAAYRPKTKPNRSNQPIQLRVAGFDEPVTSQITTDPHTDGPRTAFTDRKWITRFFQKHDIREGDVLAIERLGDFEYRLYPFESRRFREGSLVPDHWPAPDPKKPTVIDLFAGCGGFSLGLHRAGFQTLLAVEWDAASCQTFARNISPRILQCAIQEVETFPNCDLLVGGPPCQGFSNLGERVPDDPRRQLWRHYLRAVEQARPKIFVMENVPPLLKSQEYIEIVKAAEAMGYQVIGKVLNAADYGTPQTRKRAIIIGSLGPHPGHPPPTHAPPDSANPLTNNLKPWQTVREAIGDLPAHPTEANWHIGRSPTQMSLKRYRAVPPGGNRFDLPPELTPDCWKRKTRGGTDLMGRLWWDRPAVTIRTEFYKPEKGRYLHPEAHRPITHREAARLQGFPDDFEFCGKRIAVGIQIGNAVPPPLAEAIGRFILPLLS